MLTVGMHRRVVGQLGDRVVQPVPQPQTRLARRAAVQVEDRRADLLHDLVHLLDALAEPALQIRRLRPPLRALHRQADREQPLDHMVVQVTSDPVAVAEHIQLARRTLLRRQLQRQRAPGRRMTP